MMLPMKSASSLLNASRRLSSKFGKITASGSISSSDRIFSHWNANVVTSECDVGAVSRRFTCASSTAGSASVPRSASRSNSSSGPRPVRKNERRDARSSVVMRCTAPGATPAGVRSAR